MLNKTNMQTEPRSLLQSWFSLAISAVTFLALFLVPIVSRAAVIEKKGNTISVKPLDALDGFFKKKSKVSSQSAVQNQPTPGAAIQQQESSAGQIGNEPPFLWAFMRDGYLLAQRVNPRARTESDLHFQDLDYWPIARREGVTSYRPMPEFLFQNAHTIPLLIKSLHGDIPVANSQAALELLRLANGVHTSVKLEDVILSYDPAFASGATVPRDEFARRDLVAAKLPAYAAALEKARTIRNIRFYYTGRRLEYYGKPMDYDFDVSGFPAAFQGPTEYGGFLLKNKTSVMAELLHNGIPKVRMAPADAQELIRSGDYIAFGYEVSGRLCSPEERAAFVGPAEAQKPQTTFLVEVASTRLFLLRLTPKATNPSLLRVSVLQSTTYPAAPLSVQTNPGQNAAAAAAARVAQPGDNSACNESKPTR